MALANAVGNGVADDKAVYAYVPEFIRYYLGEDPILRNVETYRCSEPDQMAYVLEHMPELVVKAVGRIGRLRNADRTGRRQRAPSPIFATGSPRPPRNYIAQPVIGLSRVPSFDAASKRLAGRHVDFRPYCLFNGEKVTIVPGGLTRVALQPGSLVVNSSQGGGSKDTWVLKGAV